MAARNFAPLRALDRDVVFVFGGGTGAAAADMTAVVGVGVSRAADAINQTGTGLYTITLTDKWNKLLYFDGIVIDPGTTDDWEVVVVSETVSTTKLINIAVFKGGALADLSTDEKLKFMVVLSNTAQSPTAR